MNSLTIQFSHYFNDNKILVLFFILLTATISVRLLLYFFSRKTFKESQQVILRNKFAKGEIESYEFEQQIRLMQREEDLRLKTFFLSC